MSILIPGRPQSGDNRNTIRTRSGENFPCEEYLPLSPKKMQINAQELMKWRRNIELRSVDNYPYNCVGMIFASRRAWIEIDYIYDLLRADGYNKIQQNEVKVGDVVLYKRVDDPLHVALVIAKETIGSTSLIKVISKWGKDAEFIHIIDDVPEQLGRPAEFWTDRKSHEYVAT